MPENEIGKFPFALMKIKLISLAKEMFVYKNHSFSFKIKIASVTTVVEYFHKFPIFHIVFYVMKASLVDFFQDLLAYYYRPIHVYAVAIV